MCNVENVRTAEDFQRLCLNANSQQMTNIINSKLPEDDPYFWIYGVNNPTENQIELQTAIHEKCLGGTCREALETRCSNFTREDLLNSTVRRFCSCFLKESQYSNPRPCDILCREFDSIPYSNERCTDTSCVIDNVVINATGSRVGRVTISQFCPNCATGNCNCTINDVNLIGGSAVRGLEIQQFCGADSSCYIRNPDGTREEINCNSPTIRFGYSEEQISDINLRNYLLIAVSFIIILVFLIYMYI